ncbi:MAG TPA: M14 family metallopeptidase [Chthoniobacterales bacterium]|nr:M14 family metallopeptidase [Chthoniobacterales bacterium]
MKCLCAHLLLFLCLAGQSLTAEEEEKEERRPPSPEQITAAASEPVLPPLLPWAGKSRALMVAKDDPWITPAERAELRTTPSYDETVSWLKKLVAAAPEQLHLLSLGKSPEGREIWMVIATQEKEFTPAALRAGGKPTVLAQAGIHAGEIDGKDAGLMLLRDMTVRGTKRDLLTHANFLFVPIFNVDGHERSTRFGRVNQRGPEEMGWRTTSRNLNLNRDYAKADSPEMRAMIAALNQWTPDLYLDLHVTDGADYQYDITFGSNLRSGHSPAIAAWLEKVFTPAVTRDLTAAGHTPGSTDVANWIDENDWRKGIKGGNADPRFSTGYGDVRHLPTVLLETHSLKPYEQRVLGTYVYLESALRTAGQGAAGLRQAIESDRKRRAPSIPLVWDLDPKAPLETVNFAGVEARALLSAISGSVRLEFTGQPVTAQIPLQREDHVATAVKRAKAYWIPPAWAEVIERLQLHGIQCERIEESREVKVTMDRLEEIKFEEKPFEGHMRVTTKPVPEKRSMRFAQGAVRVPTDQPLGDLAAILLEPASPDSFLQWGFFDEVMQETEYIEPYVIEPMAERMLAADPKLAEEFQEKLEKDSAFRGSAVERLRWFYARTPFVDERWKLYPIAREE